MQQPRLLIRFVIIVLFHLHHHLSYVTSLLTITSPFPRHYIPRLIHSLTFTIIHYSSSISAIHPLDRRSKSVGREVLMRPLCYVEGSFPLRYPFASPLADSPFLSSTLSFLLNNYFSFFNLTIFTQSWLTLPCIVSVIWSLFLPLHRFEQTALPFILSPFSSLLNNYYCLFYFTIFTHFCLTFYFNGTVVFSPITLFQLLY